MSSWVQWIGLPHGFGARTEDGEAADCLLMVWSVLDESGVKHPPLNPDWLKIAELGEWSRLKEEWNRITRPLSRPQLYSVALSDHGRNGLGVSIVVSEGLLFVHHRRGVHCAPLKVFAGYDFREFV